MAIRRRELFAGMAAVPLAAAPVRAAARGAEGQRQADLGDGTFLNPVVPGDHPDPTILKDGDQYYMTFSSFEAVPGLVIWRSTDLVNWAPVAPALTTSLGTVWAVDLVKHDGRYFIYIPADPGGEGWGIFVIWADRIEGPWSDPIDLKLPGCIDPGHVVGEDGRRYLFVNGIRKVRLTDDGLATDGALEPAYAPWTYPDDWVTENFAPEGPKLMWRNGWLYLVTAVGGTAGPVTGHMVIAARSRSVHGPWEHCPHNPLVRTVSVAEPWWSRGHATLVEGPAGDWWMVYHGYENGYRTLGRQTLLEPVAWTRDGWFRAKGGDLSKPLPKPRGGRPGPAGRALSDGFRGPALGVQWSQFQAGAHGRERLSPGPDGLRMAGAGTSPADSSPLTLIVPNRSYSAEVDIALTDEAEAGLLLFYSHKAFVGIGFDRGQIHSYQYGAKQGWASFPSPGPRLRLRIENVGHVVTFRYSADGGRSWSRHPTRMEVSGLHHNVFGGFDSLKLGLFCAGRGTALLTDFRYAGEAG